jgi:hypothetical protein
LTTVPTLTEQDLEKYSSAITLSDMEIFVFPELMMSLVLANIMSPVIWAWRQEECFKKLEGKSTYRKLMRLKQFIMDEFDFNLDLETWGLTDRHVELERFKTFIDPEDIAKSNALFGYHGDQYYFDVDIRKHFGLDKYHSDIIPYWKTETVEAMKAFELKPSYGKAAGECVSLAALYAAAAVIICGVPLDDIFMILTPLHSQNFLDIQEGILTNNRRVVTKAMWFNGSEISNKAQRALKNEQVTIVSHISGHIHCLYDTATIDKQAYKGFSQRLQAYLTAELTLSMIANFLRSDSQYQKFFQVCRHCHGQAQFLKAEVLFHYEHGSNYRVADDTFDKLLEEVSDEDYIPYELPDRMRCDQLNTFLNKKKLDLSRESDRALFQKVLAPVMTDAELFVGKLARFMNTVPSLPQTDKTFVTSVDLQVTQDMDRLGVIEYLQEKRTASPMVDLAFYAFRDMATCDWQPFVKAVLERNPVSLMKTKDMSVDQVYAWLLGMRDSSIYDAQRLAQPDEVVNFKSGDGLEKAFVLANVIRQRQADQAVTITAEGQRVLVAAHETYCFSSTKGFQQTVSL